MSQHDGTQSSIRRRPTTNNPEAWKEYWKECNQPWRTECEIDLKRQSYLSHRRTITPLIQQGTYPFKDVNLSRADIEWLLATHKDEDGQGPVNWEDEEQRKRKCLDLRGANLRQANLRDLPLACIYGGLVADEWLEASDGQYKAAAIHLEDADLTKTHLERSDLYSAHLERAHLREAHLERADLREAHLEIAYLYESYMEGADLSGAHLEGADLSGAHLEKAYLNGAHLEGADLSGAHLEKTYLNGAHLESADLKNAHLEGAQLRGAYLEDADLSGAHLEKVDLDGARMEGVTLFNAFFDSTTRLDNAVLGKNLSHCISLADVHWNDVNVNVVDWSVVKRLGDEITAQQQTTDKGEIKDNNTRLHEYRTAIRANRQLAVLLQGQGLNENSAHFAYRAHICRRQTLLLQVLQHLVQLSKLRWLLFKPRRRLFSWFLASALTILLVALLVWMTITVVPQLAIIQQYAPAVLGLLSLSLFAIYVFVFKPLIRLALIFTLLLLLYLAFLLLTTLMLAFILLHPTWLFVVLSLLFILTALWTLQSLPQPDKPFVKDVMRLSTILWQNYLKNYVQRIYTLLQPSITIQLDYGRYIFSLFLDVLAGYGYKPARTLFWYLVVIFSFATAYNAIGHIQLLPDAVVLSLTSFHGRGFFPENNFSLSDPKVVLAAMEAVVGLVIEISFIATFTQRYFGK